MVRGWNDIKIGVLWVWAGFSLRVGLRSQVFEILGPSRVLALGWGLGSMRMGMVASC